MTNHTDWTDQLSDYLDDELDAADRTALEAHLASCADCSSVLNDLRRVVLTAQSAPSREPSADLWSGISAQIAASSSAEHRVVEITRRRVSFTLGQLAAAAVLLIAVSGWLTFRFLAPHAPANQVADSAPAVNDELFDRLPVSDLAAARMDDAAYDAAVADLKETLEENRAQLDPATVKTVEEDLQIIDQALDEARAALAKDPANDYLTEHLVDTRRRKLNLLRQATVLSTGLD